MIEINRQLLFVEKRVSIEMVGYLTCSRSNVARTFSFYAGLFFLQKL